MGMGKSKTTRLLFCLVGEDGSYKFQRVAAPMPRKTLGLQFFTENEDVGFAHYQMSGPSWVTSKRFTAQAEPQWGGSCSHCLPQEATGTLNLGIS